MTLKAFIMGIGGCVVGAIGKSDMPGYAKFICIIIDALVCMGIIALLD